MNPSVTQQDELTVNPPPPSVGSEPIPGYQLVQRIGSGGYGEVWKAIAPGGIAKAVKIVFGDLTGPRAEQELRALERIKSVRHPFMLSLERFEISSRQLVIVTELADRSLMQRFHECCNSGLPGIPRDELLGYLREAAECLDYLNEKHGLQHLDIKPENLLLVGTHVKVADFGLVKNLLGNSASITGGVTPIYATPEAFDGRVSRFSDQYSLAIVYQEMLTGERPFNGTTPLQLVSQHTSSAPTLTPLPLADRPIIGRALSKVPEQRFPLCRNMVEGLMPQPATGTYPAVKAPRHTPTAARSLPQKKPGSGVKTTVGTPSPDASVGPTVAPRPPHGVQVVGDSGIVIPKEILDQDTNEPVVPSSAPRRAARTVLDVPASPTTCGYRPTLYVGLGGLAGRVLRSVKRRLYDLFADHQHSPEVSSLFRFLHVDTDRASLQQKPSGTRATELAHEEQLHCPLRQPEHYREQSTTLLRWLPRRWLYGIPRSLHTEGMRPLGRLAIVDHAEAVSNAVRENLRKLIAEEAKAAAAALGARTEWPSVVLVASITGGTGGGMLIDVASAVRQACTDLGVPDDVRGMLLFAKGPRPDEVVRARVNAYATLQELWHWAQGSEACKPPLTDCYIIGHFGEGEVPRPDDANRLADRLAAYLGFDATAGSGCLEHLRGLSREPAEEQGDGTAERMTIRSAGFTSVRFPRRRLVESAGQALCRRVMERWRCELPQGEAQRLGEVALDWIRLQGLSEDAIVKRLLGRLPHLLTPAGSELHHKLSSTREPTAARGTAESRELLGRIDAEFGAGPHADGSPVTSLTAVESACQLDAKKLASSLGRCAIERLRGLVEDPGCRLRGCEIVLATVVRYLADEVQNLRSEIGRIQTARRLQRRRVESRDSMASGLFLPRVRHLFKEPGPGDRDVWNYYCLRIEEMLSEYALAALVEVQGSLSRWGQELEGIRRNLGDFLSTLPNAERSLPPAAARPTLDAPLLELWLQGASDEASGIQHFLQGLPADLVQRLDERVQRELLDNAGGLWVALRETASKLAGKLMREAEAILGPLLDGVDLTELLRKRYGEGQPLHQAIQDRVRASQYAASAAGKWEHLVLVVPEGAVAGPLREAALDAVAGVPVTVLDAPADARDELVIAWETSCVELPELAARLAGDDPAVVELAEKVQTRQDVEWARF